MSYRCSSGCFSFGRILSLPHAAMVGGLLVATPSVVLAQVPSSDEGIANFPEQSNAEQNGGVVAPNVTGNAETPPNKPPQQAKDATSPIPRGVPITSGSSGAQTPIGACKDKGPARQGFYFRVGTGAGLLTLRGPGPSGHASITGFAQSTTFAVGGSVASRLVLAATIHGVQTTAAFRGGPFEHAKVQVGDQSLRASNKAAAGLSTMGVLVDYFPLENWGWHTALSVGLGATSLTNQAAKNSSYYSASLGGTLANGYSWHLTGDWSIGVDLVVSATSRATLKEDATNTQSDTDYRLYGFELSAMSSILYF